MNGGSDLDHKGQEQLKELAVDITTKNDSRI